MQAQGKEREVSFTDERQPLIVFYDIELDDAELDPYQFRIYQRIARRCAGQQKGSCTESLEAMAAACKMSRPTVIRAVKVLIQRGMIRRESRQGSTSFYALTDKKNWISYTEWQAKYRPEPGKPESQVSGNPVNQRVRGGKPESQGVSTTESGGGSVVYTKNTNEEYKKRERESAPPPESVASVWQEVYGELIHIHAQETLESTVSDMTVFRRVLEIWKTNGYSPRNLTGMKDRYAEEVSRNQSVQANPLALVPPAYLNEFEKISWLKEQLAQRRAA